MLYWIDLIVEADELVALMGDFNINADKENYQMIIDKGRFKSSYFEINGAEPEFTFPTGL